MKCGKKSSRIFNIFGEIGEGGGTANIAYMNDVTNGFADNVDNTLSKRSKGGMDGFAEYTKNKWIDDGVNIFDEGPHQHIFATKTNKLDDFIVLKKGSTGENGWGWDHMVEQGHHSQIRDAFNLADDDQAVKDFILEGCEKGVYHPDLKRIYYRPPNSEKTLRIALGDQPYTVGSITNAFPETI